MTDDYSVERFDAILRENLYEASQPDLPADTIATLLRQHAIGIDQRGLAAHAGVTAIPFSETTESEPEADPDRKADATP